MIRKRFYVTELENMVRKKNKIGSMYARNITIEAVIRKGHIAFFHQIILSKIQCDISGKSSVNIHKFFIVGRLNIFPEIRLSNKDWNVACTKQ